MTAGVAAAAAALDANFAALIRWYGARPGWRGRGSRRRDHLLDRPCVPGGERCQHRAVRADHVDERVADRALPGSPIGSGRGAGSSVRRPRRPGCVPPVRSGFALLSDSPGMALDLRGFVGENPLAGVTIETVDDDAGLATWADINRRGLDLDAERVVPWHAAQDRATRPHGPLQNWIARLGGVPVGAAALFDGGGVAGVYNVVTVPEARRRGIGRAVTNAVLEEAVARGHTLAVLGASDLGLPVYRRLGFREISRLRSYALPE